MGNLDRIRHASQILLSVMMPTRDRVGAARVDVDVLVGVPARTTARARTVVVPASVGLEPTMMPGAIDETAPQGRASAISTPFALVLVMLAVLAYLVTRLLV